MGSEPPSASQSASEAEQFFDLAFDLFCIAGFDGYFKRVNPAYERTLGYSSRELMSRPFSEFVYPDDLQSTTDVLARLLDGHDVIGFEHRVICRDGSVRWLQWNTRTIPERAFAYCVGRDVTERRRADAELREAQRLVEVSRDELAASRARIVAATDEERRRVVRDLHDGVQQRLVHTVVTLKLARGALEKGDDAAPLVGEALDQAEQANVELRDLSHGILPTVLAHGGLQAAVEALASRTPVPVEVGVSVGRLPAAVAATAYFVVAEALTNFAKHAGARGAEVTALVQESTLRVRVRDDGVGSAQPEGTGLLGLADRLAVLDGRLRVESPAGGGTLIAADIPLRD